MGVGTVSPEVIEASAEQKSAEVQDPGRSLLGPEHPGLLEPLADDRPASCLHDAAADEPKNGS